MFASELTDEYVGRRLTKFISIYGEDLVLSHGSYSMILVKGARSLNSSRYESVPYHVRWGPRFHENSPIVLYTINELEFEE